MDRNDLLKKAVDLAYNYGNKLNTTQIQNIREMAKRDISIDEFELYIKYQAARMSKMKKFVEELVKFLNDNNNKEYFNNNIEDFRYFVGNLVRACFIEIKKEEEKKKKEKNNA